MSRVIIFSQVFHSYHPRKGEPTYFVEKLWKGLETGNRKDGEYSIWTKVPKLMKDGHWQLPHMWRDQMNDKNFHIKHHTIRAGNRWKVGDWFSPRVWSGKPYRSKQIIIGPDIQVVKTWPVQFWGMTKYIGEKVVNDYELNEVAANDGLSFKDFKDWFNKYPFNGQIICWNKKIEY